MKKFLNFVLFFSTLSYAAEYYPANLKTQIEHHQLKDQALKDELYKLIQNGHHAVGYGPAKKFLFGQLYLQKGDEGYFVKDVYCKKDFTNGVGPGSVPDEAKVNCEHTWPQSKFTPNFPKETQKSDLHHLFPTDSKANSTRGNFDFAEVTQNLNLGADCVSSKSGPSRIAGGKTFFEPPTEHKGNVARALFYFSVRYKIAIDDQEEEFLKRWNDLDPVDQDEMNRNNEIEKIQGNRNPFIDFPNLAQDIANF